MGSSVPMRGSTPRTPPRTPLCCSRKTPMHPRRICARHCDGDSRWPMATLWRSSSAIRSAGRGAMASSTLRLASVEWRRSSTIVERPDSAGYELSASILAVADEVAAAAELVMHKLAGRPVAIVRGYQAPLPGEPGSGRDLIMAPERDLFR